MERIHLIILIQSIFKIANIYQISIDITAKYFTWFI